LVSHTEVVIDRFVASGDKSGAPTESGLADE